MRTWWAYTGPKPDSASSPEREAEMTRDAALPQLDRILSVVMPIALVAACAGGSTDATAPRGTAARSPALAVARADLLSSGPPQSIVFSSTRDGNSEIYAMNPDGSAQTRLTSNLAPDMEPSLSPDGKRIAFSSQRTLASDIWLMNADGSDPIDLTSTYGVSEGWPRWSPNGKQIAFQSNRDGNWEIYVVNADGTGLERLTNYSGPDQWPEWAPDGKRLAIRRDNDVWIMDLASGALTQLTTDPALDQMAVWSPNGKQLAFMSLREGYCSVFLMNADGSNQVNLTPKPSADAASAWCSRAPAWSRNGQRIYFSSKRPTTGGDFEIFSMAADGSDVTRLTTATGEDATPKSR